MMKVLSDLVNILERNLKNVKHFELNCLILLFILTYRATGAGGHEGTGPPDWKKE